MNFCIIKRIPREYFAGTINGYPFWTTTIDMALCVPSAASAWRHVDRLDIRGAEVWRVEWEQDMARHPSVYATRTIESVPRKPEQATPDHSADALRCLVASRSAKPEQAQQEGMNDA